MPGRNTVRKAHAGGRAGKSPGTRRAGADLPPPQEGKASTETRRKAIRDIEKGHHMAPRQTVTSKRKGARAREMRAPA